MQFYTGYTEDDLSPVISHLALAHLSLLSSKFRSIITKFDTRDHKYCASGITAISLSALRYDHPPETLSLADERQSVRDQGTDREKNSTPINMKIEGVKESEKESREKELAKQSSRRVVPTSLPRPPPVHLSNRR
jgi:hypothetical protein